MGPEFSKAHRSVLAANLGLNSTGTIDPLIYLQYKRALPFQKGQILYDTTQSADHLYLVLHGVVEVSKPTSAGRQLIVDLYKAEEFFGEAGLVQMPKRPERARALETTDVLCWSSAEIEGAIDNEPLLGIALMRTMTQRCLQSIQRVESFALSTVQQRLLQFLLRMADRFGELGPGDKVLLPKLTHRTIAAYVGTSRELVTAQMVWVWLL